MPVIKDVYKRQAEAVREKERLQQEAEKIQAEKDRLLSLDDLSLIHI